MESPSGRLMCATWFGSTSMSGMDGSDGISENLVTLLNSPPKTDL